MKNTAKNLEISGLVELSSDELVQTSGGWFRWAIWGMVWVGTKFDSKQAQKSANDWTGFTGDKW